MKILKTYKDKSEWQEVSEKDFLISTEEAGYYKKGTALKAIKDGFVVQTDWAYFKQNGVTK